MRSPHLFSIPREIDLSMPRLRENLFFSVQAATPTRPARKNGCETLIPIHVISLIRGLLSKGCEYAK